MNTYQANYKGKKIEVLAESTYQAQKLAAQQFKAKHSYDVSVALIAVNGQQYTHSTASA